MDTATTAADDVMSGLRLNLGSDPGYEVDILVSRRQHDTSTTATAS